MAGHDEFSVYQFLKDDVQERVRSFVNVHEAVDAALHYSNNVAAKTGITERVIITDGGDCVVWEWKRYEGVVFPRDEEV